MAPKEITVKIQIEDLSLVKKMFSLLRGAYYQSKLGKLGKNKGMSKGWEKEVEELIHEVRGRCDVAVTNDANGPASGHGAVPAKKARRNRS